MNKGTKNKKNKGAEDKKNNELLRDAVKKFQEERGISQELLCEKICNAVATAAKKEFNVKNGIFCEMNEDYELILTKRQEVVEEITEHDSQILLEDALKEKPGTYVGDVIITPLKLADLGRIAAQSVKHIVRQGIREIEKEQVLRDFQGKVREIVTAKVTDINPQTGDATVEIAKNEALLPRKDQVPGEVLRVGDLITIYIVDVKDSEKAGDKGPKVILSRVNPGLVKRLFEKEVPEILDGTVEIRSISREAGSRSKIAVYSKNPNVDPIGSCIGPKGVRVNAVIKTLGGEKIDVIKYSDDPVDYISAALSPSKIEKVEIISAEEKSCRVTVPVDQLSLAIGNKGQNARLAARLTGWKIDIKPHSDIIEL